MNNKLMITSGKSEPDPNLRERTRRKIYYRSGKRNVRMTRLVSSAAVMLCAVLCMHMHGSDTGSSYGNRNSMDIPISEGEIKNNLFTDSSIVGAQEVPKHDNCHAKIQPELWKVMKEASEEELIPVYLWRKSIEEETISQALIAEKNMDPAVYESGEESEAQKIKEYIMAKRKITRREQSAANEAFLKAYVKDERKILYNGEYTGTLILEATAVEIEFYATLEGVEEISLYEDLEVQPG